MSDQVFDENSLEPFDGWMQANVVLGLAWTLLAVATALSIASCVACCCVCCAACNKRGTAYDDSPPRRLQPHHYVMTVSTVFCVAVAAVAAGYAVAYTVLDVQDYYGLMRVTAWQHVEYKMESSGSSSPSERYQHYVQAEMTLNWGYDWGCPNHGNRICTNSRVFQCRELICSTRRFSDECEDDQIQVARDLVATCANAIFDPQADYTPFDPTVGPSQDENWPSLRAYGNCDDCVALLDAPDANALTETRIAVVVLLGAGLMVMCVTAAVVWVTMAAKKAEPEIPVTTAVPAENPNNGGAAVAAAAASTNNTTTTASGAGEAMVYDG